MLISILTVFNAIMVVSKLWSMQLICFEIIDDVSDTSLEQRETLDIEGCMAQLIWIHQTRAFISSSRL